MGIGCPTKAPPKAAPKKITFEFILSAEILGGDPPPRKFPLPGNPRQRSRTSQVSSPRKSSAPIRDLASFLSPEILGSDPGPRKFPVVQPWKCKNSPMRCLFGDLHWLLKIFWNFPCPVAMVRSWRCGTHLIPPSRADASRRTSYVGFEKSLRRRVQN